MSESVLLKCHQCGKDNRYEVGEVIRHGCDECCANWFCDREDAPRVAGVVTENPAGFGKCYECGQQAAAPRCPVCTFCQSCCTHDGIRAERDEARRIAREILTSRPAYDPLGWKQRAPWLDETNTETT